MKLKKLLFLFLAVTIFFSATQATFALSAWTLLTQGVNRPPDGLPDGDDGAVNAFEVFNGKLYIGTASDGGGEGADVWEWDGATMAVVNNIDFDGTGGGGVYDHGTIADLETYGGSLYASVYRYGGTAPKIYRWDGGTTWTLIRTGTVNEGIPSIGKGGFALGTYGGLMYYGEDHGTDGTNFYSYDGATFTTLNTDGFGDAINIGIFAMEEYGGNLYIGTHNEFAAAQVFEYDGFTFTKIFDASSYSNSKTIEDMVTDGTYLYFGTHNDAGSYGQVYRWDGATISNIGSNLGGTSNNAGVESLAVYNGLLYAGTYNWWGDAQVFEYSGGTWTKVNIDAFGTSGPNNHVWALEPFNGDIYAGTGWGTAGAETWYASGAVSDLSLTKTIDDATPIQGEDITYTLTVTNSGPSDATGITVTDLLPVGTLYSSHTTTQGAFASGTGIWTVGGVTNGNTAQMTLTVTVTANRGDSILNTAEITASDQTDPDSTPNSGPPPEDDFGFVGFDVEYEGDIGLTKSVDKSTAQNGDALTYTIVATNNGPDQATGVRVTDILPTDVSYSSYSATQGDYASTTGIWDVGTLANGASETLSLTASVVTSVNGATITNTADVTASDVVDQNSTNDQASANTTVSIPSSGGGGGGGPTYNIGGGSSSDTKETLSGEDEEKLEEEVVEEEEIVEEEKPEEEPKEEEAKEEEPIEPEPELPTSPVITAVEEVFTPAPVYYEPPVVEQPAQPVEETEDKIFTEEEIKAAIEEYENRPPKETSYTPIREMIEENPGKESEDTDNDGNSDLYQLSRGLPLGDDNPDKDDYDNDTEFYCDLDPLTADSLESTPSVPFLTREIKANDKPLIRVCSGREGDEVDVVLVQKEDPLFEQTHLGSTPIEENKGLIYLEDSLAPGEYYVFVRGEEGIGKATSFLVETCDPSEGKCLNLEDPTVAFTDKAAQDFQYLGPTVRMVIGLNDTSSPIFEGDRFIATGGNLKEATRLRIEGKTDPGLIVFVTTQSRILSSVVISDASQGTFEYNISDQLEAGEHILSVFSYNEETGYISNPIQLLFFN